MKKRIFLVLSVVLMLVTSVPSLAQQSSGSAVKIIWPLPVTEVWGSGDVIGSAAVAGMAYYYLEYLPLNEDLSLPQNAPWIPATIAIESPVFNGVLATLDTRIVEDGLYALRLVINSKDGEQYTDTVSPLRVSNERFDRIFNWVTGEVSVATVVPVPTNTPVPVSSNPRVYLVPGHSAVNVRLCDRIDNSRCPVVGTLRQEGADVLAISANGTGWFEIRLSTGLIGWVSPIVTTVTGDFSRLPYKAPPPPLPPPPPSTAPNLTLNGIGVEGAPTCNQGFNVQVNIANTGTSVGQPGSVTLQDVNIRTGEITFTNYGGFPAINPGGNFVVVIPLAVSVYYNETHELRAYLGNSQIAQQYILGQGACGSQPLPPPPPPVNPGRDLSLDECYLVLTGVKVVLDVPYGNVKGRLEPGNYNANRVELVNLAVWYRLNVEGLGQVWVSGVETQTQGNCAI